MSDSGFQESHFTRITPYNIHSIEGPWKTAFQPSIHLPTEKSVMDRILEEDGEAEKAEIDPNNERIIKDVRKLISDCRIEMLRYERVARRPANKRLKDLRHVAESIDLIIDISAPGNYYFLNKDDRYFQNQVMQGEDRRRSDQAAILSIVLAGIKAGWPEQELLLFLEQHVLTDKNVELNALKIKARQTLSQSNLKLIYVGRDDEIGPVRRVLDKNSFIPKEYVKVLGPEKGDSTLGQADLLKKFFLDSFDDSKGIMMPINVQGPRTLRILAATTGLSYANNLYIYAMPTSTEGSDPTIATDAIEYRVRELKGTAYYCMLKKAAFKPLPYILI